MFRVENKKKYVSLLIVSLVISILLWNSLYWPESGFNLRKISILLILAGFVFFLPFVLVKVPRLNEFVVRQKDKIESLLVNVKEKKKRIAICILEYGFITLLAYFITLFLGRYHYYQAFNLYRFFFSFTVLCLILTIFLLRKVAAVKPEILCVIVLLILGVFFIKVSPSLLGVSWDDEIHYERTLNLANFPNGIMYKADIKIIDEQYDNLKTHFGYDRVSKENYAEELDEMYERREIEPYSFDQYAVWSIAYIPSAIGIVLGRGLGLSFTNIFMMGKLFNLFTYALLIYLAVKKIHYGKILITVIGLIPTNVFMAASYSYDPWIIGFIILGYAYFFSYLQEEKK